MYDVELMTSPASDLNQLTYIDYLNRLTLIARSVFKWKNLPNNINEKWIEKYLFTQGKCMFFKDPIFGFMVTKITESGQVNFYDEPTLLKPTATNYSEFAAYLNDVNSVLIQNNDMMIPTVFTVQLYAQRLAEISRAIDVNVNAQKTPILIQCQERQKLSLKNVFKKWQGNEPVIYGSKDLDANAMTVLKTEAPVVFPDLQLQKHAVWNECMTFLGINNANQDKRERLVSDEVAANDEIVESCAELMLKARQRAAERINEIFGTNIEVVKRTSEIKATEPQDEEEEDEADDNES